MTRSFAAALLAAAAAALVGIACGSSPTTADTTTIGSSVETFTGTLNPGDLQFRTFAVVSAGRADFYIASLRPAGDVTRTLTTTLGLAYGVPSDDGTACNITTGVNTAPALTSQMNATLAVGTYCLAIYDIGVLTAPVDFTVFLQHT